MYVPYQFNYSQVINATYSHNIIPYNYSFNWFKVSHFPVMTSPHQLKLYQRHNDKVQFLDYINGQVLGIPVEFYGIVLDYYDKPAETTGFHMQCLDINFTLANNKVEFDNDVVPLNVVLVGQEVINNTNVTLLLQSHINYYFQQIEVTLIIELVPCYHHPAYIFNKTLERCVCYHNDVVECYDDYNEIKSGYWFGNVNGITTTSLCPNQYCSLMHRRKTREGYIELTDRMNDQCAYYRSGPACGECRPGYTLTYDSTNCIHVDHCSTGMTVLVVALTFLYWIAIVGVVFILMYFNFQLSVGYLYGIVYYYSLTEILLSYNPFLFGIYIQVISISSGFAQLTPQFLRQLCLVEGMSRIDQLFIHSFHAGAVSVLVLVLVLISRYSRKVSAFISHCIIRVLSLLLLLVYTSLASTLLQPLRPLRFTGINEVYTYASPNIKYFHGRHMLYVIVAVICEVFIVIGVPLFLLFEKFLNRRVNLIKLKPILDQFQGCYKDEYRWFACYYMICRQVILGIVFTSDNNYSNMLLILQTTCVIIAAIHMWFQPYKTKFLNLFDGMILILIVLIVNLNTFDLMSAGNLPTLIMVVLPLIVLCIAGILRKVIHITSRQYVPINAESDDEEDPMRNIHNDRDLYHQIQEPLLDL
ncbi:uncharacterized protein [Dysidea avara]|uniref:uncharacterized protein n=1 Tax=Dysidea avara TaxID=196820 RepID=UPI00332E8F6B